MWDLLGKGRAIEKVPNDYQYLHLSADAFQAIDKYATDHRRSVVMFSEIPSPT